MLVEGFLKNKKNKNKFKCRYAMVCCVHRYHSNLTLFDRKKNIQRKDKRAHHQNINNLKKEVK